MERWAYCLITYMSCRVLWEETYMFQESVVEIEYVERHPAPEPEDSLQHDDWVSAVEACND